MTYSFSHRDATMDDVATIYEFGKANPMHADVACSPFPYMTEDQIVSAISGPNDVIMIFDDEDGTLCSVVAFDDTGKVQNTSLRRFTQPGEAVGENEKGNAFGAYLFDQIRTRKGAVISQSQNPNTAEITLALGAQIVSPQP